MQCADETGSVLAAYPADCQPSAVEGLGAAGGFSGAEFWRLTAPRGLLCLRRWPPEHPSAARLEWIQSVVAHVCSVGFGLLPTPIATRSGKGYHVHEGRLWELTPWTPGEANYWRDRRPEKLRAALHTLARFHLAAATFPTPKSPEFAGTHQARASTGSPGIAQRLALVRTLLAGGMEELKQAARINRHSLPPLADQGSTLFALLEPRLPALERQLERASGIDVLLQPCLRDIWHDHVLFLGDRVSGIVDLGSMKLESVTGDIGRLLGSFCGNDSERRLMGLAAYDSVRHLSEQERELVEIFDRSQALLSGVKWIEWVFVGQRVFADPAAVVRRMEHILARLKDLPP
jgi:Ser/Thr protein kinase RdoA (MazF antagonist)